MTDALKAIILGIVQGITEFLPISSSAHLLALERVLDFHLEGIAFDVSLHVATLLAVVLYFRGEILGILRGPRLVPTAVRIVIATVPIGVLGYVLRDFRKDISPWFAVGGWIFSGAYLLLTRGRSGLLRYSDAPLVRSLGVGLAQALSIFPGVSRSGSSISAGLWLGLTREEAAKFSFMIAIPAMVGAGLVEGIDLLRSPGSAQELLVPCATAMPVALVVGLLAIHLLLRAVRGNVFWRFGWYNLAAAAAFAAWLVLLA